MIMYVCNCKGITEADFKNMVHSDFSYDACAHIIKTTAACCKCLPQIKEIFSTEDLNNDKDYKRIDR